MPAMQILGKMITELVFISSNWNCMVTRKLFNEKKMRI